MEHRADIEQLVQSTKATPREIHDIIDLIIVKIRNENGKIHIALYTWSLQLYVLDFEHCIKNALRSMWQNVKSWGKI